MLVCIAIVAVLIGLLFVAIQSVRQSARVTICQSRVADIVKASLNYESGMGRLPDRDWQAEIYEHLSLNILPIAESRELQTKRIEQLICPNDSPLNEIDLIHGSYLACSGSWIDGDGYFDGVIAPVSNLQTKVGEITDGLSNTSFVSEGMFPSESSNNRLRKIWTSKTKYPNNGLDEFVAEIDGMPSAPEFSGWSGTTYPKSVHFKYSDLAIGTYVGLTSNMYNHAVGPQLPMVLNGGAQSSAIAPASSTHSTVTVGFCDGHVKQFSPSVDRVVWRSIGARNDGPDE